MVNKNRGGDETRETSPSPAAAREDDAVDAIRTEVQCEICAKPLCGDGRQVEVVITTLIGGIVDAKIVGIVCKVCSAGSEFEVLANGSPIGGGPSYQERRDAEADGDFDDEAYERASNAVEIDQKIREALDPVQLIEDAAKDLDRWEAKLTIPEVAARILDQRFAPISAALWANRGGFGTITALARAASGVFARRALEKGLRGESPSEAALHGERPQESPQRWSEDAIPTPPTAVEILRRALVESDTRYISCCSDPIEIAKLEVRGANFVRSVLNRLLEEIELERQF